MLVSIAVCLGNAESLLCAVGCIRSVDFVACTAMSVKGQYIIAQELCPLWGM